MTQITVLWNDRDQAGVNFARVVRPWCLDQWALGRRLAVTIQEAEDDRTIRQNKFLWGFVYKHISEQAQVEGIGATAEGWNHYYKKMFLGYRIEKTRLPGKKRPTITRTLRSTKDLKIKPMSDYLDKVMAHSANTFGVAFPAGVTWESYREGGR